MTDYSSDMLEKIKDMLVYGDLCFAITNSGAPEYSLYLKSKYHQMHGREIGMRSIAWQGDFEESVDKIYDMLKQYVE